MNVLSLFDGMSCGRIALERSGHNVTKYHASEIDKHAIKIALKNYPDTVQLGDVQEIEPFLLPKIDLLIGGSPCQGFSFAGKQLNFEDPRSKLFFEFVRIWEDIKRRNPAAKFLLENVQMKKASEDIISEYLGVKPIKINSALVSAQNRKRLYWTNIEGVEQPEDRGIYLKDILEDLPFDKQSQSLNTNPSGRGMNGKIHTGDKSPCLTINKGEGLKILDPNIVCRATVQANAEHTFNGKSPTLTASMGMGGGNVPLLTDKETAVEFKGKYIDKVERLRYRKLSPTECERLQTVPDGYTEGVSNSQRYKMLGNGWTVEVIAHILSYLPPQS